MLSNPVPQSTIFQVAGYWYELQTGLLPTVEAFQALPDSTNPSLYKIDYSHDGFVVISADDSCIPILGFCDYGDLVTNRQNEASEDMLLDYIAQIDDVKTNNRSNAETLLMEYSFETQMDHESWYWVSFPVLNTRTNGMLQASEFFRELLELGEDNIGNPIPTYLDEITWVDGGDPEPIHLQWLTNDWSPNQYSHTVSSPQGYKIKLLTNTPNTVTLKESGFKTPDTLQFPLYENVENWIGYFKDGPQSPRDAFSNILNDIVLIKAKNWSLYRDPSTGQLTGKQGTLNYGDMVIVVTNNDHTFQWSNNSVVPPIIKQIPKAFTFDEKPDYIPVYVNLPDSLVSVIKEIGLYVDGVCKGAVVVEDNIEQISAYVDSVTELSQGNVEYVFSYEESKSHAGGLASISLNPSRIQAKYGVSGNKYPYFEVNFNTDALENMVPPEFAIGQNYPNPFNPSTTLSYTLPESARVRLDIYNLKGQLVNTLVDSQQDTGHHSSVWNGKDMNNSNVASGVYLYRLSSPHKSITRKMLLMK